MLQTGIVTKQNGGFAEVEITRSSACGESCASCGLCPGQTAVVEAINDMGAAVGDGVIIDMADKKVLSAAFLVYIVPVIMLIAGYFAGEAIFGGETSGIITGFLLMIITFSIIIFTDKKRKSRYTPRIVEIKERRNNGIS